MHGKFFGHINTLSEFPPNAFSNMGIFMWPLKPFMLIVWSVAHVSKMC